MFRKIIPRVAMNDKADQSTKVTVELAYSLLRGMRGLSSPGQVEKPVIFNDLYGYILGSPNIDRSMVEKELESNVKLKAICAEILSRERTFFASRLVAAQSTEVLDQRTGEGFVLKIRESKADPNQYYLILEVDILSYQKEHSRVVLHAYTDEQSGSCVFPALQDGKSQIIMEKDNKLLKLLRDSDPEISIV